MQAMAPAEVEGANQLFCTDSQAQLGSRPPALPLSRHRMEATFQPRTAAAVEDLNRALAVLGPYRLPSPERRLATAYLSIESAKELLCDEREQRAVLLLRHARKVLVPVDSAGRVASCGTLDGEVERGLAVARHLESALWSLGLAPT